jgi:hypothetical protein
MIFRYTIYIFFRNYIIKAVFFSPISVILTLYSEDNIEDDVGIFELFTQEGDEDCNKRKRF